MGFWNQFDEFDPQDGNVPRQPFPQLARIAARARRLLSSRGKDEIITAALIADSLIENYFESEEEHFIREQLEADGWARKYLPEGSRDADGLRHLLHVGLPDDADTDDEEVFFDLPSPRNTNDVEALKSYSGIACIESPEFKEGKDYEYFAALALWLIGDCISMVRELPKSGLGKVTFDASLTEAIKGGRFHVGNLRISAEYALLAMEAVCYGEQLLADETRTNNVKALNRKLRETDSRIETIVNAKVAEKRSSIAKSAAEIRHKEHRELRDDVIDYYTLHEAQFSSVEEAGRAIAGEIVPVTHRTVVKWIHDHKKIQSAR